ncbi:MAG TPA: IS701 family transposase [Methanophagales archaeon]|nr:IS701 family transposase [Methanophagales archaeon]
MFGFWQLFRERFKTKTRDTSEYAYNYMSGQLRMEKGRNFVNIGFSMGVAEQNMHHFMSNSPWSAWAVIPQVQVEIAATQGLGQGGVLILDESADAKAGEKSAGAGRQYNGRLGKVDMSQVGTFLAHANGSVWTWVDGELYLPKHWFAPEMAELRKKLGITAEREFETKIELGWKMIQRTHANGLSFEAICCDDFYGHSSDFRAEMNAAEFIYMADVPHNTPVYLKRPVVGVSEAPPGKHGRKPSRSRVLSPDKNLKASDVARQEGTNWRRVRVRDTERGVLNDEFAARRVWTIHEDEPVPEWLVMRREGGGKCTYSLSNASPNTPFKHLAWLKCQRYFVERANQDAKSELGWDELEAQKYLAWMHHLALTILALWFITQTKIEWAEQYARDPTML